MAGAIEETYERERKRERGERRGERTPEEVERGGRLRAPDKKVAVRVRG